jgi:polyhydroxyalkanoate synthesis regulator phasin
MSIWDALEKAAYTGLGLAALTKDKLDEAVETLKKERGLTEDEGRRLAEELKDGAETARRNLDDRVDVAVEKAYKRLKLASHEELESLKERVAELERQLKSEGETGD